jgi:hypothetical protein
MSYYALIKNNVVSNVIKASESYIDFIKNDYIDVVDVTDLTVRPAANDIAIKFGDDYRFGPPPTPEVVEEESIDEDSTSTTPENL